MAALENTLFMRGIINCAPSTHSRGIRLSALQARSEICCYCTGALKEREFKVPGMVAIQKYFKTQPGPLLCIHIRISVTMLSPLSVSMFLLLNHSNEEELFRE